MAPHDESLEVPEDELRTYSLDEQRRLTENLLDATRAVHAGQLTGRRIDPPLLQDLHASVFRGVRDHAGRHRDRGVGAEFLRFGPHRSVHRDRVRRELDDVFRRLARELDEARLRPEGAERSLAFLEAALRAHAEVIRVHPFEDGNGRSSRLLLGTVLVACGMAPIPVEAPKQEYIACLNHYLVRHELEPLVDLYLRLAAEA